MPSQFGLIVPIRDNPAANIPCDALTIAIIQPTNMVNSVPRLGGRVGLFVMRFLRLLVAASAAMCFFALPATAKILIEVDKSTQTMTVSQDGSVLYTWPVSTGVRAHDTPGGAYTPFRMEKDHYSKEWDDAPMPNSIFFTTRGHAIHGTTHRAAIGRPASHGCVRLELENARTLFALVRQEGMPNTKVVLTGTTPGRSNAPEVARRAPTYNQPGYADDDVTGSVAPQRVQRGYDDRPVFFGQNQPRPRAYDEDRYYRRLPPPPPGYVYAPNYGWGR